MRFEDWCFDENVVPETDLTKNIGNPAYLHGFVKDNKLFVEALPFLRELLATALNESRQDSLNDKLVVELANLAFEDFEEIVTLCANGFARGGLKVLRAMFEHTVTMFHLDENDEHEAKDFHDYYAIDQYKAARPIHEAYPGQYFSEVRYAQIEAKRNEVKDRYLITCDDPKCKDCCKPRVNHAWTKVDIVQMAKKRGFKVYQVAGAYYIALDETHPKMGAIYHRIRVREGEIEPDDGKGTLTLAHSFLLEIVRVLKERSEIEKIEDLYKKCRDEFNGIWAKTVKTLEEQREE